ncbi:MAG: hypothetical protein ABW123_21810 [Cystobacter sp.]
MNRLFAAGVLALSVLVGCGGGEESPGGGNPSGNPGTSQKCSASNCAGCCFNNVCQTGTTASACGKAGATCGSCGSNQVCKMDQTCGVDPNGVWLVQPISARITPDNNGSAWDGDGSPPDVFISMWCPGSLDTLTSEVESYNPTWTSGGCTAKASELLANRWLFQLWDSDISSDDTITNTLGFQFTEQILLAGTASFQASGGLTSLTVQLRKLP